MMRRVCWTGIIAASLVAFGCGSEGEERASVSGTVVVDGEPLAEGSITFLPTEGTTGPTSGAVIKNGKYVVPSTDGVVVGKNRIVITGNRKTGKMIPNVKKPDSEREELVEALTPESNSKSTLVKSINPGSNTIDFDLKGTKSMSSAKPGFH